MKTIILTSLLSLLIGSVFGWFLYEQRAGVNMFDCAIVETKMSLVSRTKLVETINSGGSEALESAVVEQLQSMVSIIEKYEDRLCTRVEAELCQNLLKNLTDARSALAKYESGSDK